MIKAHPTDPMLRAFAADELPLPLAVGLSAHCELCPDCAARLKTFEEELAQQYLASPAEPELAPRDEVALDGGFDAMLADKKRAGDRITLVMFHGIGDCRLHSYTLDEARQVLGLGLSS